MAKSVSPQLKTSEVFERTLKKFSIKGSDLSKAADVTSAVISDFKNGKANPSTEVVERLVEGMDNLAPGAWQFFYNELATARGGFSYTDAASQLDAVASYLRQIAKQQNITQIPGSSPASSQVA